MLTRRSFLQVIAVAAGPLACSSDSESHAPGEGGAPDVAPVGEGGAKPIADGRSYFPQSVASGDPKPDSIILWTRVIDDGGDGGVDAGASGDLTVSLQLAKDALFQETVVQQVELAAPALHDGTLRVKVVGLTAKTTYYYRFIYEKNGTSYGSQVGRTRTAPAASDDAVVRFAVASCQDLVGRYYNAWQRLRALDPDLDFVLFLGDYVYETTGDPGFMSAAGARAMTFADPASALPLGTADSPYFAANSVSNYRDLYKTVRADKNLQAVHERYPFVFVWDDHEFSDDCHGATSTYTDGRTNESMPDRRRNAEQVFFEYVPLDHPSLVPPGAVSTPSVGNLVDVDALAKFPDTRIYRDLGFGKNLRLIVADYRTYRPDHVIPEDAFPATVVMTEDAVAEAGLTQAFASDVFAYIDIDHASYAVEKVLLGEAYKQLAVGAGLSAADAQARATEAIQGPLALVFVNAILTNPAIGFTPVAAADKPRGLAWVHMGKRDLFSSQGSRYVVVKDTFDAYTAYRYAASAGQSENVFGAPQEAWVEASLALPEAWKVLVSSVSFTSLMFDLRGKTDIPDASLRNRYYLNADMWDGFPNRRRALLKALAEASGGKALIVSGDIHASFASVESSDPSSPTTPGVVCLTTPAISSGSVKSEAAGTAKAAGFEPDSAIYRYVVTEVEQSFVAANPGIAYADADRHGFIVVELDAEKASAAYHLIPSGEVHTDYAGQDAALAAKFLTDVVAITPGKIIPLG